MKTQYLSFLLAGTLAFAASAHAQFVTFNFAVETATGDGMVVRNGPLDANSGSSGSITANGLTVTLFNPISLDGSAGTFDAESRGIGVDGDTIDWDSVNSVGESFQISFDKPVILESARANTLRAWLLFTDDSGDLLSLQSQSTTVAFPANLRLEAGDALTVSIDPNDPAPELARLTALSVTVVPEPSVFAALAGMLAMGLVLARRKR